MTNLLRQWHGVALAAVVTGCAVILAGPLAPAALADTTVPVPNPVTIPPSWEAVENGFASVTADGITADGTEIWLDTESTGGALEITGEELAASGTGAAEGALLDITAPVILGGIGLGLLVSFGLQHLTADQSTQYAYMNAVATCTDFETPTDVQTVATSDTLWPGAADQNTGSHDNAWQKWAAGEPAPKLFVPACSNLDFTGHHFVMTQLDLEFDADWLPSARTVQTTTYPLDADPTAYPLCVDGGSAAPCSLMLFTTGGATCNVSPSPCADWWSDSTKTQDYTCKYGPYDVTLADCAVYEHVFDDPTQPSTDTGTSTTTSTDTNGDTTTTTTTTTGVSPATGDGSNCIAGFWSWNPVDWVYVPVKCALIWAFVPTDAATTLAQAQTDMAGRQPWSFILAGPTFMSDILGGFDGADDGCTGDTVTDDQLGLPLGDLKPWCALSSGAGQGLFTVSTMRGVALAGLAIAFLWACYHRAKRLIGDTGPNDPTNPDAGEEKSYSSDDMLTAWESGLDEGRGGG